MSKVKIFLGVLVAFAILYSGFWYINAMKAKEVVLNVVGNLEQTKVFSLKEYKSISVSGFPFNYSIVIEDPKWHADYGMLLNILKNNKDSLKQCLEKQAQDAASYQQLYTLDGSITLSSGFLAKDYNASISGIATNHDIFGEETFISDITIKDPITLAVSFEGTPILKGIGYVFAQFSDAEQLKKITGVALKSGPYQMIGRDNQELLYSSKGGIFSFTRNKQGKMQAFGIKASIDELIFTDAFKAYEKKINAIKSLQILSECTGFTYDIAKYGQVDANVDLHLRTNIDFTKDPEAIKKQNDRMVELNVNEISYMSDFGNGHSKGKLLFEEKDGRLETISADFDSAGKTSPLWYNDTVTAILASSGQLKRKLRDVELDNNGQEVPDLLSKQKDLAVVKYYISAIEKMGKDVAYFVPKLHELGTVKNNIHLSYNNDGDSKKIAVDAFNYLTDLYGIKIQGNFDKKKASQKAKFILELQKADILIDDLASYSRNIILLLQKHNIWHSPIQVTDALVASVKKFLRLISDAPSEQTENITITMKSGEGALLMPSIGTLDFAQAMMVFQQQFLPFLQEIQTGGAVKE